MTPEPLSRYQQIASCDCIATHQRAAMSSEAFLHLDALRSERGELLFALQAAEERAEALRAALVEIAETGECECTVSWVCLSHQANDALMFDDERIASRGEG